ncbi:MAG: alpha-galactosidase [Clostridia bacterium]|nr:alpha-galactosidase [Clostridia bacterium]
MEFTWKQLTIVVGDDGIPAITRWGDRLFEGKNALRMPVEVQILGEYKNSWYVQKLIMSGETDFLRYVTHSAAEDTLIITLQSSRIEANLVFTAYDDTNTFRVYTEIRNISGREIRLEEVSSFVLRDIGGERPDMDELFLHRFIQVSHLECRPRRDSFETLGFPNSLKDDLLFASMGKIGQTSVGSWSTKEAFPQGIIEDAKNGTFIMFQMESNNSWHYEISDYDKKMYLWLGRANRTGCSWSKVLKPDEIYETMPAALCIGDSVNGVLGEMTKYRRHISGLSAADSTLPIIFNEFMHFAWEGPSEETTRIMAPVAAEMGVEYYVIDCGWHNEEPADTIHRFLGHWQESKLRFPNGVKATLDYIRSLGMKPGLWIEPEVVSQSCKHVRGTVYDDDCFLSRDGVRIGVKRKNFLDYRNPTVIAYMNEVIRRMVEDYGTEYIKFDYNADLGVGCDRAADSLGDGLEQQGKAFLSWIDGLREKYPHVVFEACAAGGMRMDYATMSHFSLVSTSDQSVYNRYPYIAGNITTCVLPEQAAVWSYPVADHREGNVHLNHPLTRDITVITMVNSLLGRMHLASRLDKLSDDLQKIVKEGITYYNSITEMKKRALPYLPEGYAKLGQDHIASGLVDGDTIYLAVWYLHGENTFTVTLPDAIGDVKIGFPSDADTKVSFAEHEITLSFTGKEGAVFLEITKK